MVETLTIVAPVSLLTVTPEAGPSITIDVSSPAVVELTSPGPQGAQGPTGPQGPAGPAGGGLYEHEQPVASDTWIINHNLGRKVDVAVFTVGGLKMLADVVHMSTNQARVLFAAPTAGSALVN